MALTPAEKQRRYREKINRNPEKREDYLKKMRETAKRRRDLKIDKSIGDLSEREKRFRRKEWKERQKKCREKKKRLQALVEITPPSSPCGNVDGPGSNQSRRGRKKIRKDRSAAYRRIKQLQEQLSVAVKKKNKYKKKFQRLQKRSAVQVQPAQLLQAPPLTKLNEELKTATVPKQVKKQLLLHKTLIHELKETYKNTSNAKNKQSLAGIINGKHAKKYKLKTELQRELGIYANTTKAKFKRSRARKLFLEVKKFYTRDDNSIQTPGKKQSITFRGVKKQKRLLTETLMILHKKFCDETKYKISKATFLSTETFLGRFCKNVRQRLVWSHLQDKCWYKNCDIIVKNRKPPAHATNRILRLAEKDWEQIGSDYQF